MSTASKTNGAKSRGPVTPEGKARSAANSLRHGLSSKAVVLPSESADDYQALLASYVERFQPADPVEMDLVESMAVARWRLRRITNIETHLLSNDSDASSSNRPIVKDKDDDRRLAYMFERRTQSLTLLMRYEASFNRTFDRAFRQLQLLQKTRPTPDLGSFRNLAGAAPLAPHPSPPTPAASPRAIVELGNTPPVPGVYAGLGASGVSPSKQP